MVHPILLLFFMDNPSLFTLKKKDMTFLLYLWHSGTLHKQKIVTKSWFFATKLNFLIIISLQPDVVDHWDFCKIEWYKFEISKPYTITLRRYRYQKFELGANTQFQQKLKQWNNIEKRQGKQVETKTNSYKVVFSLI